MNPTVPKNLIAVKDAEGDHVMGYLTMFSVPDRHVSASKIGRAWASEALPTHLLPAERKAVDTFKNACRSVETRRTTSTRTVEVKVDQVEETYGECVYQVTHMVRDHAQRQIDHPKAMRVTFNKIDEQIAYEVLSKRFASGLDDIEAAIDENFNENLAKVPGSKVRTIVRGLFSHVGAVNMRGKAGGVYFVPKSGKDDIDSLTKVLDYIYGEDSELHYIPMADAEYHRNMVQKKFEISVGTEIDETISLVADKLIASRRMRSDAVGNLLVRRKELGDLQRTYAKVVNDDLDAVTEKLELLDKQLSALVEQQAEKK